MKSKDFTQTVIIPELSLISFFEQMVFISKEMKLDSHHMLSIQNVVSEPSAKT